ncbi:hypothetical protein SAMN06296241_2872 [Salinimicrobium sediminis]|uniref:Uncharacterized protein n=1 Tax=Salinimicrobium sediminis TaxID=1343891 RepID=A0A285X7H2_9FLAO|nr:hypothetical protein [Salinimicrobium sediminis]SOC81297.1 hypothetical protein SAMN06296241_2872 [Salinimicrobium sediminis]
MGNFSTPFPGYTHKTPTFGAMMEQAVPLNILFQPNLFSIKNFIFFWRDIFTVARHALRMGWISKDQLDTIKKSCEEDAEE